MKLGDRILLLSAVINGLLICCCCQSVPEGPTSVLLSPSSLYYTQTEESRMNDFSCSASCRPDSCTYSWQKSGREVTNSNVLSLGTLYRDEAGNYTCTARNPRSSSTSNSETIVIEVIHGPSIHSMTLTPSNLSYTIIEGHILNQITCYDACAPDCTYYWRNTYETVSLTAILSLGSVKRGDAWSSYECIARNPRSSTTATSRKVRLRIIYGPDSVTLSTSSLHYYSTKGSVSEIRCFDICFPSDCSFSWRKSGVKFSNTSALSLGSVYRDEAGSYTCTAKNPDSQMSSFSETIIVEVMYKEDTKQSWTMTWIGATLGLCLLIVCVTAIACWCIRRKKQFNDNNNDHDNVSPDDNNDDNSEHYDHLLDEGNDDNSDHYDVFPGDGHDNFVVSFAVVPFGITEREATSMYPSLQMEDTFVLGRIAESETSYVFGRIAESETSVKTRFAVGEEIDNTATSETKF